MTKLKIAVIFGGCSEEHDVSIKSAREIAAHIDTDKFDPVYIGITRPGSWKMYKSPGVLHENDDCPTAVISPDKQTHGLLILRDGNCQTMHIDAVFPVLHGKMGEDGTIQGLLELSGIPYVGCGIQSSVMCMDKSLAYMAANGAGIATPEFRVLNNGDIPDSGGLCYPVFVKPARSGSSFGVTKVTGQSELARAVELARQYDDKVLIEQAVSGSEVGCAVLGSGDDLTVGEVDNITLTHGFFRIHQEEKPETGSENAVITVPANLPPEKRRHIQETAKTVFTALGCEGLARVDMFLRDDGCVILNEVNTLPGFTSYSRYPRMMTAAGIPLTEIINRLIELALGGQGQ